MGQRALPTRDQLRAGAPMVTKRLKLRPFLPSDLAPWAEMNVDPEVMEFLGGFMPPSHSHGMASEINAALKRDGYGKIAIERLTDGAFLGIAGLSRERWYPDDLEIGWRLARPYWGSGYATEAGTAWLAFAFDVLGVERVISVADVPNLNSIAVMQRLGMQLDHTAELDDEAGGTFPALVYAIRRTEFVKRQVRR
ncbi:MAG: GCN5-related N-acetyltransferase [Devosia sp.]|nr:GCN5-related N-acetyltransferase [Devosia sp.]